MDKTSDMKTIFPKWKINEISYLVFLSFLLTGYIKNILLIFTIICVHELGHLTFLRLFHYEIEKIEIYPFGGLTTTKNKYINSPINKDIFIYFGGILFQSILYLLFFCFLHLGKINQNTFHLFTMYNKSIFFFNLLPIRPLDGGEIVSLFLEKFFPYEKAYTIMNRISLFSLSCFILYTINSNLNNYIIITFLLCKTISFFKKKKWYIHKFLLERYMHSFPYKKIEHNERQKMTLLKKETLHFFKNGNKYLHEQEILRRKFDIQD